MDELIELVFLYANGIIMMGMMHYAFTRIFRLAVGKIWIVLSYLVFLVAGAQFFFLFGNIWITIPVNIITNIALSFLYSGSISVKIVFSLLLYVSGMLAEGLAVILILTAYYIQYGYAITFADNLSVARTATTVVQLPLILVLIQTFRRYMGKKVKQGTFKIPHKYTIVVAFMLLGAVLLSILLIAQTPDNIRYVFGQFIIALLLSSGVIIAIIWLYNTILNHLEELHKNRLKDQMLERWEVLYDTATSSQKAISAMKHNMRYDLLSIFGCLEENDVAGAKKLIADKVGDVESVFSTGNSSIDTLLNYYQQKVSETLGISLELEHLIPPNLHVDTALIALILGNALENAVEACMKVPQEQRYIKVVAEITAHSDLLITIINPYLTSPISDDGGNLITIKENKQNHGIGLSSIRDILDEDTGQVHLKYNDGEFRFMLIYYSALPKVNTD